MSHIVNQRMRKRQPMCWSLKGTHFLLQVRCAVLDGRFEALFREWVPKFRLLPAAIELPVLCHNAPMFEPVRDTRTDKEGLIRHSERRSQHLSIRYSERLAECGIPASVGTTGDSYDNALAETINGLNKVEVIWRRGPCSSPLAIFRPRNSNRRTIVIESQWPWPRDYQQKVSGEAGAVHSAQPRVVPQ